MKTETVKLITVDDWDKLVSSTYHKIYSFQQQDDCKDRGIEKIYVTDNPEEVEDYENTSIPYEVNGRKMGVSFETWLNTDVEDTQQHFNPYKWENTMFWERNFYPHISALAHDLYKKGLLEKGSLLISIDW